MPQPERIAIAKIWLDSKGLQFREIVTQAEQERCNMAKGFLSTLVKTLKLQYSETIKLLQLWKQLGKGNENTEEWMGILWLEVVEYNYMEVDRQLKEQLIYRLNVTKMLAELISELTKIEKNSNVTSEQVLAWAKRVEAKRTQSAGINNLNEIEEMTGGKMGETAYACQNAHESGLQILWIKQSTKTKLSIWKEMHEVQDEPFPRGLQ